MARTAIEALDYDRRMRQWVVRVRGCSVGIFVTAKGRAEARRLGEPLAAAKRRSRICARKERRAEARRLVAAQIACDMASGRITAHRFGPERGLEKRLLRIARRNRGLC